MFSKRHYFGMPPRSLNPLNWQNEKREAQPVLPTSQSDRQLGAEIMGCGCGRSTHVAEVITGVLSLAELSVQRVQVGPEDLDNLRCIRHQHNTRQSRRSYIEVRMARSRRKQSSLCRCRIKTNFDVQHHRAQCDHSSRDDSLHF